MAAWLKSRTFISVAIVALAAAGLLVSSPSWTFGKRSAAETAKRFSPDDLKYLHKLAQDTWTCIDYLVDKNSQLPYDNVMKGEYTSVSNIGVYTASLTAAVEMGFIPRKEAVARLTAMLENLTQFTQWNGFTQSWNSVHTGAPATHDPWISTLDSGNFYAGLMVGRAYFPELAPAFSKIIDAADWGKLYNPETKKLRFGYNRLKNEYNGDLNHLGSDSRLAYFIAIARGMIPAESWRNMIRDMEERYGLQYLQPGWQGGGLFMQYISGLILDEKDSFLGASAANFAYAQILHARNMSYPAWGWSACAAPTGEYLGMGALKDNVVTPHASVLAMKYYPALALANLKVLEEMGARKQFQGYDFGFRDSIDITNRSLSENYLVLDQCMLFLGLANTLQNDFVVRTFKQDPVVRKGYKLIADLQPIGLMESIQDRDSRSLPWAILAEKGVKVKPYLDKTLMSADAVQASETVVLDGDLSEWKNAKPIIMGKDTFAETDTMDERGDLNGTCYFMWDGTYLYFAAKVRDNDMTFTKDGADIWKDDCIELYIAPQQDSFVWGTRNNFQIGLAASSVDGNPKTWAWFQDGATGSDVVISSKLGENVVDGKRGYIVEARIRWDFLGIKPYMSALVGVSPAIHWVDANKKELKLNWSFLPDGKSLGKLTLVK